MTISDAAVLLATCASVKLPRFAGDALQTLAFRTIAEDQQLDVSTRIALVSELARAAGTPEGMVAGQALDMEAEARHVNANELEQIHRRKTGALIVAAARCGAIIGQATEAGSTPLPRMARI